MSGSNEHARRGEVCELAGAELRHAKFTTRECNKAVFNLTGITGGAWSDWAKKHRL